MEVKPEQEKKNGSGCFGIAIIVAIVLILAAIAIPDFLKFGGRKSPQSEARTNLGAIFTTQVSYFANANTYSNDFTLLNWAPAGNTRYAYTCGAGIIANTKGEPIPPAAFNVGATQISATGFTCMAVGNIDNDTTLDYWTINDAKSITNTPTSDLEF